MDQATELENHLDRCLRLVQEGKGLEITGRGQPTKAPVAWTRGSVAELLVAERRSGWSTWTPAPWWSGTWRGNRTHSAPHE